MKIYLQRGIESIFYLLFYFHILTKLSAKAFERVIFICVSLRQCFPTFFALKTPLSINIIIGSQSPLKELSVLYKGALIVKYLAEKDINDIIIYYRLYIYYYVMN